MNHSVIQVLTANNSVRVLGAAGRWVQVEWRSGKDGAIQGWIFGKFLADTPLTQKELERPRMRSKGSNRDLATAVFCLLAIAPIYLIRRSLAAKRNLSPLKRGGGVIVGKAYVTDGDGIRVSGYTVRLAGLDAPEWDQPAQDRYGYWFNHGQRVKGALIQAIGGKHVRVTVEGHDKYGRVLGTVTCDGDDVGAWLVRNGHAISAYGGRYKHLEGEARQQRRGMWGLAESYDPRAWRGRQHHHDAE